MKRILIILLFFPFCLVTLGQSWEGYRFSDITDLAPEKNWEGYRFLDRGEIQTYDSEDLWWDVAYIDSLYWGSILSYPPKIEEIPKLNYDFDPYVSEKRWKFSEPAKVILLFGSSVVLEAIGDAKFDDGQKELGKLFQAASLGILIASPFILNVDKSKWYWYFLSYTTMRMALFDPAYNLTRGLNMGYTGSTSYWDKGIQMFNPPQGMKIWGHSVVFILAISIPVNQL